MMHCKGKWSCSNSYVCRLKPVLFFARFAGLIMIVLGLIDSKPSAAAIVKDGEILAAVAEERLCRMKMADGMPRQAIREVLQISGVTAAQIDLVSVAQNVKMFYPEPKPWKGWFEDGEKTSSKKLFDALGDKFAPWFGQYPIAWRTHHRLKGFLARNRLDLLPTLLKEEYGIIAPVQFYDHHLAHAASAFFTSGYAESLVITLDGGGDGRSGSVYWGENGSLTQLASVSSFNSLGNFYSYITELCGFKAEKHEGKITGLAATGDPVFADIFRSFIGYEHPGKIMYKQPMYMRSALEKITEALPASWKKEDMAASVQLVTEEIGTQFAQYWLKKTGAKNIALAGGVFGNVRLNQCIFELPQVEQIFIHPAMDDSGLSVGGALLAFAEHCDTPPSALSRRLPNVYLGGQFSDEDVERAMLEAQLKGVRFNDVQANIARLLADGHVVARVNERMEYGPRALGNRTIMYQTTDPSVNDWLNERLNRTEFMPFAPATLIDFAEDCYIGIKGALNPARFMTITFTCTPEMIAQSPGVVHVDNTARPQIVDDETSPDFYKILHAYHALTGIPSLINTSFNMHGEPIVYTPGDALRSFQAGQLDFLAIGDWIISHPTRTDLTEKLYTETKE